MTSQRLISPGRLGRTQRCTDAHVSRTGSGDPLRVRGPGVALWSRLVRVVALRNALRESCLAGLVNLIVPPGLATDARMREVGRPGEAPQTRPNRMRHRLEMSHFRGSRSDLPGYRPIPLPPIRPSSWVVGKRGTGAPCLVWRGAPSGVWLGCWALGCGIVRHNRVTCLGIETQVRHRRSSAPRTMSHCPKWGAL